ncbi:MAG: ABC transporter ATP-binding protein [Alcanivoracaceae bacterium]|nr:ABC transporter ATP-binding protein [Alcanivoracaceae bacterium]
MITIKDLSIENHKKKLITKLNVQFKKGEFWAILGKNGTGKTSLIHTMAGFLSYKNGSIKINDQELKSLNILSRAQNISLLPQMLEANLGCTVEQSISYGRYPWYKNSFDKEIEEQAINFAIEAMELDDLRNENIQQISGGELRKVEIATILAQNSEIMMLDEPLNHLDLSFRYKLMELLKQLNTNKIIIIVTHDIQYVQEYCSHVIMLLEDSHTIIGTSNDIMTKENLNKMLGTSLPNKFIKKTL